VDVLVTGHLAVSSSKVNLKFGM